MDPSHRALRNRQQNCPSGAAPAHGSEAVTGQGNQISNQTVSEPTSAEPSSAEDNYEDPVLQAPGPSDPFTPPSPGYCADGSDREDSKSPERKKMRLCPEARDAEIVVPRLFGEGSSTGATSNISGGHGPSQQANARRTSRTASAGHHRDLETPGVTPRELTLSQPSTEQDGSSNQHLLPCSQSPGPHHVTIRRGSTGSGRMQASPSTGYGPGCDPERQMAAATTPPSAHETAPQEQSQADVSGPERPIELQPDAEPQPVGTHTTTAIIVNNGGPQIAANIDHLDNQHSAGSTIPCLEPQVAAVAAGPSTAPQLALQHDPEQQESETSGWGSFIGSSPLISPEVAPHLHSPSPPHDEAHESPMHHPGFSPPWSPPSSPHHFIVPDFLLYMHLAPSFSDLMAAQAPEAEDFELIDDDIFDMLAAEEFSILLQQVAALEEEINRIDPPGMSQNEINLLDSYIFPQEANESEAERCVVCLSEYQAQEVVRVLPCRHEFHALCVDMWLLQARTCPICRRNA